MIKRNLTEWISVRVTPEFRVEIEQAAVDQDRSVGSLIREALKKSLRDHDTNPDTKAA